MQKQTTGKKVSSPLAKKLSLVALLRRQDRLWNKLMQIENSLPILVKDIADLKYPKDCPTPAPETATQRPVAIPSGIRSGLKEEVAKKVCVILGHKIGTIEVWVPNPVPPKPETQIVQTLIKGPKILCLACGMALEEIRGEK